MEPWMLWLWWHTARVRRLGWSCAISELTNSTSQNHKVVLLIGRCCREAFGVGFSGTNLMPWSMCMRQVRGMLWEQGQPWGGAHCWAGLLLLMAFQCPSRLPSFLVFAHPSP